MAAGALAMDRPQASLGRLGWAQLSSGAGAVRLALLQVSNRPPFSLNFEPTSTTPVTIVSPRTDHNKHAHSASPTSLSAGARIPPELIAPIQAFAEKGEWCVEPQTNRVRMEPFNNDYYQSINHVTRFLILKANRMLPLTMKLRKPD